MVRKHAPKRRCRTARSGNPSRTGHSRQDGSATGRQRRDCEGAERGAVSGSRTRSGRARAAGAGMTTLLGGLLANPTILAIIAGVLGALGWGFHQRLAGAKAERTKQAADQLDAIKDKKAKDDEVN